MPELTLAEFCDRVSAVMPVISREFFRHQSGEFYKLKITMPQFVVLEVLYRRGESKMTELAHFINVTTAAMTGIVDRLVRERYAERANDPDDRRVVKIRLTEKGESLARKMIDKRKEMTVKIFAPLSQNERKEYLKILERIRQHLAGQKK